MFEHKARLTTRDVSLLRIGRHFRVASSKIIVGRNEEENKLLFDMASSGDYIFEVPGYGSPITILEGPKSSDAIEHAAKLTARYSDAAGEKEVLVEYMQRGGPDLPGDVKRSVSVSPMDEKEVVRLRI